MNDNQIQRLPLQKIVIDCAKESQGFRSGQKGEGGFCLEILRRAIEENDQDAWEAFYQQYKSLISLWLGNGQNTDDLIQLVFEKFFKVVRTKKFVLHENIGEALYYLKRCSISVKLNYLRGEQKLNRIVYLEDFNRDEKSNSDRYPDEFVGQNSLSPKTDNPAEIIEQKNLGDVFNLWCAENLQDDWERLIVTLSFEFGLTPKEIADNYKDQFIDVAEVRRIKERILLRFHRSVEFQKFRKDW